MNTPIYHTIIPLLDADVDNVPTLTECMPRQSRWTLVGGDRNGRYDHIEQQLVSARRKARNRRAALRKLQCAYDSLLRERTILSGECMALQIANDALRAVNLDLNRRLMKRGKR